MLRWIRALLSVLLGVVALALLLLAWAHVGIRRAGGPLPDLEAIRALPVPADAPVRLVSLDTATQPMPRGLVLDPARDPDPGAPYQMSHPAFLLQWRDGRGLLVDLGMDADAARGFGGPSEWFGAEPIRPHGAAAPRLARWIDGAPLGVIFSHLHPDHVQGALGLCARRGSENEEVALFQSRAQAERGNHTTWPASRQIDTAACLRETLLDDAPLAPVPGYPGVHVLHSAGHTPGSQVVIARLRQAGAVRTLVFTGDVVNHVDGVRYDVPKPGWYRWLVTPESDERLGRVRRLIGRAETELGAEIVVAHDRLHLERLGLLPPSSASALWPEALRVRGEPGGGADVARDALERILRTRVGARVREALESDSLPGPLVVAVGDDGDNLTRYRVPGRELGETIAFDPSALPTVETEAGPLAATPETVLAHELGHALFKLDTEDAVILEIENPLRSELGLPVRTRF